MVILSLLFSTFLFSGPSHFNYQGRLFNEHGEPIDTGTVDLRLQLKDPSGECLLIEESRNITMTGSDGYFSVIVGLGSRTAESPSFSYSQALSNSEVLSDAKLNCAGNSYTPSSSDARVLRVFVDGEQLTPDHVINAVPYAIQSERIAGKSLGEIEADYQVYADQNLAGQPLPDLQASPLVAGDSFKWDGSNWITFQAAPADLPSNSVTLDDVSFASSDGIDIPQLASDPGNPTAGQTYFNTTTNKTMVYDGSSWVPLGAGPWDVSGGDVSYMAGNVGVGTTSPTSPLHVSTTNNSATPAVQIRATSTSGRPVLSLLYNQDGSTAPTLGTVLGVVDFGANDGTATTTDDARIRGLADGTWTASSHPSVLAFQTTPSGATGSQERMRIDSSGNIGVGTTSPDASALLDVSSTTKGFLPPRMTSAQRIAVSSPADGLVVYDTDEDALFVRAGGNWVSLGGAQYAFQVSRNGTDFTIPSSSSYHVIDFTQEYIDSDDGYNLTTDRFQPGRAGYYWLHFSARALVSQDKSYYLRIRKNDAQNIATNMAMNRDTSDTHMPLSVSGVVYLNGTTDYVDAGIYQESGAAMTIEGSSTYTKFGGFAISSNSSGGGSDNLGNHTASQNITLGSHFISGDGDNEGIQIDSSGNVTFGQNATFSGDVDMSAANIVNNSISVEDLDFASSNGINIPQLASAPGSPTEGQLYYNTTEDKLYVHNGTSFTEVGSGSGGAATSMIANWPDAIRCSYGASSDVMLYLFYVQSAQSQYLSLDAAYEIRFNSSGVYLGSSGLINGGSYNCMGQNISDLNSAGQTWLLAGGGSSIWTASGADSYFVGGNIGIGTTTPSRQLQITSAADSRATMMFSANAGGANIGFDMVDTNSSGESETTGLQIKTGGGTNLVKFENDGNVGIGTTSPNATALLDISSTSKGFLPPRMTSAQRDSISSPAAGLQVYNIDDNELNFYNGSEWSSLGSAQLTYSANSITGSQIYSADTENNGDADNAADGNNGTHWRGSNGPFPWWAVDFGSGNEKKLRKYEIDGFGPDVNDIATIYIEGSSTGAWAGEETVVDTWSSPGLANGVRAVREFTNSSSYRYYRLRFGMSPSNAVTLEEVEMFEGSGGNSISAVEDADGNTRIHTEESSNEDIIRFDTAGTERMIIDSSGNIGIGTTTPLLNLDIEEPAGTGGGGLRIYELDGGNKKGATLYWHDSDYVTLNAYDWDAGSLEELRIDGSNIILATASGAGNVGIGTASPIARTHIVNTPLPSAYTIGGNADDLIIENNARAGLSILAADNDLAGIHFGDKDLTYGGRIYYDNASDSMAFSANNIERLRVNSSGNVGIGTTNPSHLLHVNGVARSTQSTFATSSDRRVKEDIHPLENTLDLIMKLRPVTYKYIGPYVDEVPEHDGLKFGFIAQEVQEVFPDMVEETAETFGSQSIEDFHVLNLSNLTPRLVKAIQELNNKNSQLQIENDKLRGEMRNTQENNRHLQEQISVLEEKFNKILLKMEQ